MINRRHFFKGILAVPIAAVAAPLAKALSPEPKPFVSGGIVPAGYVIGEARLPISTSIKKGHSNVGEIIVEIHCDSSTFLAI
jgi:hypothetical protein